MSWIRGIWFKPAALNQNSFYKREVILVFPFSNTYRICFINDFSVLLCHLKQNKHRESASRMIKKLTKFSFEQKYYENLMDYFPATCTTLSWLFSSALTESGELSNFWSLDYKHFIPVKTARHWMPASIQTVRLLLKWNTDTVPSVPFTLRQFLSLYSSFNSNNFRTLSVLTTRSQSPEQT